MCEIPSNVIEADEFSPFVDGIIGGNDLLQLTLGGRFETVEKVTHLSNYNNLSYRRMIQSATKNIKRISKVGFCVKIF